MPAIRVLTRTMSLVSLHPEIAYLAEVQSHCSDDLGCFDWEGSILK